jgi:hypothetical protein
MGHTITIRLDRDLAAWLEETAAKTGVSQGQLVREQLEKARASGASQPFMRLAGSVKGRARDLSSRKGYSKR